MAEGGRASWKSESSSDRSEDDIDPEQRQKYRDAMGFEPWVSWSEYFSVSERELDEWNGGKQTSSKTSSKTSSTTSPKTSSPRRLETLTFDEEGNYVIDKRDKTTSPKKATISPRSIILRNSPIKRSPPVKTPISELRKIYGEELKEELQFQQTVIRDKWKSERTIDSYNLDCTICGDLILRRPYKWDRLFGLLPKCSHIFCLNCIVERGGTGRCPTCDKNYLQIIPSPFYVRCRNQKERMLNAMKKGEQERTKRECYVDDERERPIAFRYEPTIRPGSYYDTFEDFTCYPSTQSDSD